VLSSAEQEAREQLFMNRKGGKKVQCASRTMRGFVALIALAGTMSLLGCSENVEPAIADDLNNKSFTFQSGAVFNPGLANMETTLAFNNNAANFTLSSAGGAVVGSNTFGNACTLTVTGPAPDKSPYAIGAGPQMNDVIRLAPCDFDIDNKTLLIGNGTTTATSLPAVPTGS
jgi:hypothetical protein